MSSLDLLTLDLRRNPRLSVLSNNTTSCLVSTQRRERETIHKVIYLLQTRRTSSLFQSQVHLLLHSRYTPITASNRDVLRGTTGSMLTALPEFNVFLLYPPGK